MSSGVWATAGILLTALTLMLATVGVEGAPATTALLLVAFGGAAAVLGWALWRTRQVRRSYEDDLTSWAAERAAQAERLRIARDLHDLASHGLGLITVRAAAAQGVTGVTADAECRTALADIERAGRQATTELRRMLTVLRGPAADAAPLRPAETLADLPGIVEAARTGGLRIALDAQGLPEISAGVQLTVCAVVREALANSLRHAGPTSARVLLHREGTAVVVEIADDGPVAQWRPQPGAGQGLAGLRERVVAVGGTVRAEAGASGFVLHARLPEGEHR